MPLDVAHGGIEIARENACIAGVEIVKEILREWDRKFLAGIPPNLYVGNDPKKTGSTDRMVSLVRNGKQQ